MNQDTNLVTSPTPDGFGSNRVVNVFIGGLLDRSSGIVRAYQKSFSLRYPHHTSFYFEHDQCREVISCVKTAVADNAAGSINLIAHSWGAVTAIKAANELAREGIKVDQVITIDPVSRKRIGVTDKSTRWINVNAVPATSNGWNGDYWATVGGKWDDWPRGKAAVHYWAPCHHNEFASLFEFISLDAHCALHSLINPDRAIS